MPKFRCRYSESRLRVQNDIVIVAALQTTACLYITIELLSQCASTRNTAFLNTLEVHRGRVVVLVFTINGYELVESTSEGALL